jgi:hypothetical protein
LHVHLTPALFKGEGDDTGYGFLPHPDPLQRRGGMTRDLAFYLTPNLSKGEGAKKEMTIYRFH